MIIGIMSDKTLIDEMASWFQDHTIIMFLLGLVAIIWSFGGSAQFRAIICVCSGIVNLLSGMNQRYRSLLPFHLT
jgi:hypothetical protein